MSIRRPTIWLLFVGVIVFALVGCRPKRIAFSSDIKMSDHSSERQLISGFHDVEQHRWRWTSRRFAVVLQPPPGAEHYGATLRLRLFIAGASIKTLGPITLRAEAEDIALAPELYSKDGTYTYSRKVPPAVFRDVLLPVTFTLNKALVSDKDLRELGAVIEEVSLDRSY